MSDIEDILAGVPSESGKNPLAANEEQGEETPAEVAKPEENQEEEETPPPAAQEKQDDDSKLPFHKHPRWKEMYESKKRLETETSTLREELEKLRENMQKAPPPTEPGSLPERFVKLYGDNPEAYRLFQEQQRELAETIKNEIREESVRAKSQEDTALQEGARYVEDSLASLEDEGKEFDRNELMKFMLDFQEKYGAMPSFKDERGVENIDFERGYELMTAMKPKTDTREKSRARKDIAAFSGASSSRGNDEGTKDYLTSQDLRNTDWDTLIGR